jgi:hypothetical protein
MRRGPGSLLLATALHASVLAWLTLRAIRRPARPPSAETQPVEVELDVPTAPPAPPAHHEQPAASAPVLPARKAFAHVAPGAAATEPRAALPVPVEPAPPTEAKGDVAESPPAGFRMAPPGISAPLVSPNLFLASGPREGEGEHAVDRAVRQTLSDRDKNLGLGASGPVVSALEGVARTSTAEVESHAVFEVVADGEGRVVSVALSEASEGWGAWREVGKELLAAMAKKRVRVRHGARGLAMTIAIDSREALPSGAAPGVNVTLFDQKVHSGKNARSAAVSVLPLAKLPVTVSEPGKPGQTKTVTIVLPIPVPEIGGVFDVVDLDAPAARVVHAHAVEEAELE